MCCRLPGCSEHESTGSHFCTPHHENLARILGRGDPIPCQTPGCENNAHRGGLHCSRSHREQSSSSTSGGQPCMYPRCPRPAFRGSTYCSKTHRDNASRALASPPSECMLRGCSEPVYQGSLYCSIRHRDQSNRMGAVLQRLSRTDNDYQDVRRQIMEKWLHNPNSPPTVKEVYRIHLPSMLTDAYETYRDSVEEDGDFVSLGYAEGNERRRFHGTKRNCRIGDNGNTQMCASPVCSLCRIMKHGFDLSMAGRATSFQRFGYGIYTSSTSSKSNDYSENLQGALNLSSSPSKAMLLNKVVVGKGKILRDDDRTLTEPPPGYDSVLGEPGSSLNYDETVVYDKDAIIPAFLIIYVPQ
ncbi:ADP-ribosylation [Serendipita vermifera]|nr:ADP-ribosylation [Serendipita vermifera]